MDQGQDQGQEPGQEQVQEQDQEQIQEQVQAQNQAAGLAPAVHRQWPDYWSVWPSLASGQEELQMRKKFSERRKVGSSDSGSEDVYEKRQCQTLARLSGNAVVETVSDASKEDSKKEFWKDPKWLQQRTHLQESLLPHLVQEAYSGYFEHDCNFMGGELDEACPFCNTLGEKPGLAQETLLINRIFQQPIRVTNTSQFLAFLSESDPVASLKKLYFTKQSSLQLFEAALNNQTNLNELSVQGNSSLSDFLKLKVDPNRFEKFLVFLFIFGDEDSSMPPELFDQFLDFLAKAESLRELSLYLTTDSHQMSRLWTVLGQLPNLRKLDLSSRNLQQLEKPSPLDKITSLQLSHDSIDFEFELIFPSLVEFEWRSYAHNPDLANLDLVTKLSSKISLEKNPFEVLNRLSRAEIVDLNCYEYDNFELHPFQCQSVKNLRVKCKVNNWTFPELKAVFTFFPNLTDLKLYILGLDNDFDEQVFIQFLEENRPHFSNLRNLHLQLRTTPTGMTAQTMMAILRNSNLDSFTCLVPLPAWTSQEQEEFRSLLAEKDRKIRPIFKSVETPLFPADDDEGDIPFQFFEDDEFVECDNGRHFGSEF